MSNSAHATFNLYAGGFDNLPWSNISGVATVRVYSYADIELPVNGPVPVIDGYEVRLDQSDDSTTQVYTLDANEANADTYLPHPRLVSVALTGPEGHDAPSAEIDEAADGAD